LANASFAFSNSDFGLVSPPAVRTRSVETELGLTNASSVAVGVVSGGGVVGASGTAGAGASGSGALSGLAGFVREDPHRIQYFRVGWLALPHLSHVRTLLTSDSW
jgi:hypothetical protein